MPAPLAVDWDAYADWVCRPDDPPPEPDQTRRLLEGSQFHADRAVVLVGGVSAVGLLAEDVAITFAEWGGERTGRVTFGRVVAPTAVFDVWFGRLGGEFVSRALEFRVEVGPAAFEFRGWTQSLQSQATAGDMSVADGVELVTTEIRATDGRRR